MATSTAKSSLSAASEEVKRRHIANCARRDSAHGLGVALAMGLAA
ncbi:MAG TPA: hypothetical protein VHK70_09725 [Burkholderiaceae bacterium]|nr:hypothetical protein [Burkholderiaceae bacterium]